MKGHGDGQTARLPAYLQIEPAGVCNLRCAMCAIRVRRDNRPAARAYMQPDLFRRTVDALPGLERLHLQGLGEPLLSPHFFGMAAYAASKGVAVTASSNLTLLDEAAARALVESGLQCLHVSVDGASAAVYESIRKGASFGRLLANIRLLEKAKDGAQSRLPALRMTVVLMRRNLAELTRLVELASGLAMEQVFIQGLCHSFQEPGLPAHYAPMREYAQREGLADAPPEEIAERFGEARARAVTLGIDLRLPPRPGDDASPGRAGQGACDWPETGIYISYQGYVMPCCMAATPDRVNFGKTRGNDIADIWNGRASGAFRQRLASADPPDICKSCALYTGAF